MRAGVSTRLQFDRGTLIIDGPRAGELSGVVFDERTRCFRASAHRYRSVRAAAIESGDSLDDQLSAYWRKRSTKWARSTLRSYQREALAAWLVSKRGTIVLPTGSGKTHVALAAAAALRVPTAILCPTRVLLAQWVDAVSSVYDGSVGVLGDAPFTLPARDPSAASAVPLGMRHLVVCLLLTACSSSADVAEGPTTTTARSDERGAAIALAKTCVDKNGYKPVWNTTIAVDRITATHVRDRAWVVDFPETGHDKDGNVVVLGLPQGMMLEVDLDAKTCRQMMLE